MKSKFLMAGILASMFAASAFAQSSTSVGTSRIEQRQANQQKRIDQGVQSGALTSKEAQNLEKRESKIQANEQKAQADGTVTAKERRKLIKEEDRASRKIFQKKHNHRTASASASNPGQ